MNSSGNDKTSRASNIPPALTILAGVMLMAIMIVAESEPGGVPLLVIIAGVVWYFVVRTRSTN